MFRNYRGRLIAQVANHELVYPGAVDRMNDLELIDPWTIHRVYDHGLVFPRMIEHLGSSCGLRLWGGCGGETCN